MCGDFQEAKIADFRKNADNWKHCLIHLLRILGRNQFLHLNVNDKEGEDRSFHKACLRKFFFFSIKSAKYFFRICMIWFAFCVCVSLSLCLSLPLSVSLSLSVYLSTQVRLMLSNKTDQTMTVNLGTAKNYIQIHEIWIILKIVWII